MRTVGFQFQETMAGTYSWVGDRQELARPIRFTARAVAKDALRHLMDGLTRVAGTLDMEGFADGVPLSGTLGIALLTQRTIRYDLSFAGNDGLPYRLVGQKELRLMDLVGSLTTLDATIHDGDGRAVARARLSFDLRKELLPFIASLRPVWS